jgi:perosamine synthetase
MTQAINSKELLLAMYLDAFDIGEEEVQAVADVVRSKRLGGSFGDKTKKFEASFADYLGVKFATSTCSQTAALYFALGALGVGPGDEVIVPACSSLATPNSVVYRNAVPVFADIDEKTLNICPTDVEKKITPRTKAIIAVHMYGWPVEMDSILQIAKKHNLFVIEDCALAMGAEYHGRKVGTLGDLGCFSFGTGKQLNIGQGGMVVTNNEKLGKAAAKQNHHYGILREGRAIGAADALGHNYKMTEMQAAIGLVQLKKLDRLNAKRIDNVKYLSERISGVKGIELPIVPENVKHVFNMFNIKINEEEIGMSREDFRIALAEKGAYSDPLFDTPMHLELSFRNKAGYGQGCPFDCPIYKEKGGNVQYREGLCPTAESCLSKMLGFSIHPGFNQEDLDKIAAAIRDTCVGQ